VRHETAKRPPDTDNRTVDKYVGEVPLRLQVLDREALEERADSAQRFRGLYTLEQRCVNYLRHCASAYDEVVQTLKPWGRAARGPGPGATARRAGGPMRMPFGQYRGKELTEVPRPYLEWLRGQEWLGGWLAQAIDDLLTGDEAPHEETFEEALQRWRESQKRK
jgi:hypothetical protein